jgi:hypothetical protein
MDERIIENRKDEWERFGVASLMTAAISGTFLFGNTEIGELVRTIGHEPLWRQAAKLVEDNYQNYEIVFGGSLFLLGQSLLAS